MSSHSKYQLGEERKVTYEQLDFIADSYIPLLFIAVLGVVAKNGAGKGLITIGLNTWPVILGVAWIYSLMFIDEKLQLWPSLGLDYSTHTALALVFVTALCFSGPLAFAGSILTMLGYCLLMVYQEYHSIADIVSTALVILPVLVWLNLKLKRTTIS